MAPQAADTEAQTQGRAQRLRERAVEEMRRFAVLFLYLWVLFGLFVLNERIILQQHGIGFAAQGFAVFNALVLAKVMLVAENLNLGRWLERRPLIYPILHDASLFTALFIVFHVAEEMTIGLIHGATVRSSVPAIGGGGAAGLLCVAVISFVALIPFFAFRNFSRALGPDRMNALLFGTAIGDGGVTDTAAEPARHGQPQQKRTECL
jgi:hypothetical protein